MEYGNWGCEFIEDSQSGRVPPSRYLPDALWLPLSVLEAAADPKYLEESKRLRRARIESRKLEIAEDGIETPGLLLIGRNQVYLKDGNHRLIACKEMGWEYFPVLLQYTDTQVQRSTMKTGKFLELITPLISQKKYLR